MHRSPLHTSTPGKPHELKLMESERIRQSSRSPGSVDSGIGLDSPDRALSPVSSITSSTPSRSGTPHQALESPAGSPRWMTSVQTWILAEIQKREQGHLDKNRVGGISVDPEYRDVIALKGEYWQQEQKKKTPKVRLFRSVPVSSPLETVFSDDMVDHAKMLKKAVTQTRIITTVFEVDGGGLSYLIKDLGEEMDIWFTNQGVLVVCMELVWSVPGSKRDANSEILMKDGVLRALRGNNRKVLDLNFAEKKDSDPVILPDSTTEEVSGKEKIMGTYQGIYRRYYGGLISYGHKETSIEHKAYWELNRKDLQAEPEKFLMGNGRSATELKKVCLVAVNLVTIKFRK